MNNILFFLTPKAMCAYLYDDFTLRQALEKMESAGYAALPILNKRGEYMQAVLWYMFLFNAPVEKVKFVPEYIPAAEADLLQASAAKALKACKQVK